MRTGLRFGRSTSGTIKVLLSMIAAGALAAPLAACNETTSDMGLAASQPKVMAPMGMPIAVESLSGGSEAMRSKFAGALSQEASQRQIELVGAGATPRYRIRGYLDASPAENGKIAVSYVWDVYDTAKQRAQRVEGAAEISGSASDPWSAVDEAALKAVAARSMNDIAGFLVAAGPATGNTLVAAGARPAPAGRPRTASGSASPLAYAAAE